MPSDDDDPTEPTLFDTSEFASFAPHKPAGGEGDASFVPDIPVLEESLGRELYSLAADVLELRPWEKVDGPDMFGVASPDTGEVMVASIRSMEEGGHSVRLYLQPEGICFLNSIFDSGDFDRDQEMFELRMIECEFFPKNFLGAHDLEAIKRFAPKSNPKKGQGSKVASVENFAHFRSFRPGYLPWQIDNDEAQLIAIALRMVDPFVKFLSEKEESLELGEDRGIDFHLVGDEEKLRPLIPLFTLKNGGDERVASDWEFTICPFPEAQEEILPDAPFDEFFLARLADYKINPTASAWECTRFFTHEKLKHRGKVVFATVSLTATGGERAPFSIIGTPDDDPMALAKRSFAEAVEAVGYLPAEILVQNSLIDLALSHLAVERGIKIVLSDELPELERFAVENEPDQAGEEFRGYPPALLEKLAELAELKEELPPQLRAIVEAHFGGLMDNTAASKPGSSRKKAQGAGEYRRPKSARRYVLRIDIKGAKPPIWRRISMPTDASMFDLHCAIQDAFGWADYHLHNFELRDASGVAARVEWDPGKAFDDPFGFGAIGHLGSVETLPELGTTLEDIMVEHGFATIHYTYDFGDDWEHKIVIEKELTAKEAGSPDPLPKFLKGNGACPPEDCGGIWAYQDLLDGGADPDCYEDGELEAIRANKFDPAEIKFGSAEAQVEWHQDRNDSF